MEDDALQDPEELTRYCSLVVSNPRAARRMLPAVEGKNRPYMHKKDCQRSIYKLHKKCPD